MIDFFLDYVSKPFAGFILLVKLFHGEIPQSNDQSIGNLKFIFSGDSIFIQMELQNGLAKQTRDLLEGGVIVNTTCSISCGLFSKLWERRFQYNPISQTCCYLQPDNSCEKNFTKDSINFYFNKLYFYLSDKETYRKIQSNHARIEVSSSVKIDAMDVGKKDIWPAKVSAEFDFPKLQKSK